MKKYNFLIKNLSFFIILEMFLIFIISLLNLIGLSTSITTIIIFIINLVLFFLFGFIFGKTTYKKGYISGLSSGLLLIFIMSLLAIILYKGEFNINLILYYATLLCSTTFGGMVGKSKKIQD